MTSSLLTLDGFPRSDIDVVRLPSPLPAFPVTPISALLLHIHADQTPVDACHPARRPSIPSPSTRTPERPYVASPSLVPLLPPYLDISAECSHISVL
jgi:hypothetical protein